MSKETELIDFSGYQKEKIYFNGIELIGNYLRHESTGEIFSKNGDSWFSLNTNFSDDWNQITPYYAKTLDNIWQQKSINKP